MFDILYSSYKIPLELPFTSKIYFSYNGLKFDQPFAPAYEI